LWDAFSTDQEGNMWTYLSIGPFNDEADKPIFFKSLRELAAKEDSIAVAVIQKCSDRAVGFVTVLRISPEHGTAEVGFVTFSPLLQRTTAATETIYLLLHATFTIGYRRVEWKCDSLNAPSRKAASRFGFKFEGIFRQHMVYKGRNRDTAWHAILDSEWNRPGGVCHTMQEWLRADNFDREGRQLRRLGQVRADLQAGSAASGQGDGDSGDAKTHGGVVFKPVKIAMLYPDEAEPRHGGNFNHADNMRARALKQRLPKQGQPDDPDKRGYAHVFDQLLSANDGNLDQDDIEVELVGYHDGCCDEVRAKLLKVDAVIVWHDPVCYSNACA
jgi:RimJ/RimL family protein N-acetyltransferase